MMIQITLQSKILDEAYDPVVDDLSILQGKAAFFDKLWRTGEIDIDTFVSCDLVDLQVTK